ncbi:MAG: hypothetical protein PHS98_04160 [Bacilli bacterium]|nr:hypothetical protein [Bacilli bacterium]
MKALKKFILLLIMGILLCPLKSNASNNTVNIYLFYNDGCPHCEALEVVLSELKEKHHNLEVYKYEASKDFGNSVSMGKAAKLLNARVSGVPFTIIGTKYFVGYSSVSTKGEIENTIKVYSSVSSYSDPVGEMLGVVTDSGTLTYDDIIEDLEKNSDYIIDIPILGPVEAKKISLPIISVVLGTLDGFNPCAMWVLLFLISVLMGMKDRKRMWILGLCFLFTSAIIYLAFMLAWLNLVTFIGALWWVKLLIALAALIGGYLNLKSFIKNKDDGCEVIASDKRKKTFSKIKDLASEKSFLLSILGIITLAVSVNFIELTCSAGLPVIFTNVLALNNLSLIEYSFYIFLYIFFFLLDDLIVFFIAMISFKLTGISTKYGKYSHLIGGVLMILIGILMLFKPEWLMFNF